MTLGCRLFIHTLPYFNSCNWWPKGSRAFRSAIMEVSIYKYAKEAKKFLFPSGPVGPRSDIIPKIGFLLVLVNAREAKNVSAT
jgi:hypothetical protein